ncbi:MAG: carbohydrate binding domain-containing protein [Clostridia bacterium]|nr:carbohydrate binding domain-containing protein [Clostridia bacterium]
MLNGKKMKKAICLLLAAVLIVSTCVAAGIMNASADELSYNGTFETLNGWSFNKYQALRIVLESGDGHSANGAMRFNATTKTGSNEVTALSDKITVQPATSYDISYWMKQCNLNGAIAYLFVFGYNAAGAETNLTPSPIAQRPLYTDNGEWTSAEDTFTTGADTVSVAVRINVLTDAGVYKATSGGYFLLDDLSITAKGAPPLVNDGTLDGSFERVNGEKIVNWNVLGHTYFDVSATEDAPKDGDYALKITSLTDTLNAYQQINSNTIDLLPDTRYELSYWVKDGGLNGATGYVSLLDKNEKFVGKEDLVRFDVSNGFGTEWKQVSAQFMTGSEADGCKLRITVAMWTKAPQQQAYICFDGLSVEPVVEDNNLNLGFEDGLHNWDTGTDVTAKIDEDVYHGGARSLCISKDDVTKSRIISKARIPVQFGQNLLFGGYMKSCGGKNAKVRINLLCYDADGSCTKADTSLRRMLGRNIPVCADGTPSDWNRWMIDVAVPDDTVSVGFELYITEGAATVWFDDLFYRVSNISADETLVDFADFSYTDNTGKIAGWTADGKAELKAVSVQSKPQGVLTLSGNGKAVYRTDYLLSGNHYNIELKNYTAPKALSALVEFYDYQGKHLSGKDVKATLPAGESKDYKFAVTVPSSTFAKVSVGGEKAATYTLEKLNIIKVYQPNAAQSWLGRWIWYNEDTLTQAQYETRYFRHSFTLQDAPTYAPLQISADDNYTLYVNGAEVGGNMGSGQDKWQAPETYDILRYLKKGENVICIAAKNFVSYGGLVYDCRVTTPSGTVMVCSEKASVKVSKTAPSGWTAVGFDDSHWTNPKEIGPMGSSPWGSLYFNSALYAENKIEIVDFKTEKYLKTDSTAKINATISIDKKLKGNFPFEVYFYKKNSSKRITSATLKIVKGGTPDTWKVGKNAVTFEMHLPDYLETGSYTLQLSDAYYYLTNADVIDRMFATVQVVAPNEKPTLHKSEVKMSGNKPTVFVDGEAKTSLFYLSPAGDLWWDMDKESRYIEQTGTEFYVTNCIYLNENNNRTEPIWVDAETIDYDTFDRYIYEAMSAAPDSYIVVDIGMQAPNWWLQRNPKEAIQIYDSRTGKTAQPATPSASFASEKYRNDAGEVLRKLIRHMLSSSYIGHIAGIKIQDGETEEYMTQGVEDWTLGDFSEASLQGFRKYLKTKYKTNAKLQAAYGSSKVTFDNVVIPDWKQRGISWLNGASGILDPATNQITIDYNYYSGLCATETLLHYADIVKKESSNKMLCGAYHAYLWAFSTAGGANGSIHPAVRKVLDSKSIDFICSPFIYGERSIGEAPAYDAMMDGVLKAGKLYILEIDTRSVFEVATGNADWDADVGYCYTMQESIDSIKRDMSTLIAKGAGFWIFNMYGSWWYDDQMLQFIRDIHEEMQFTTCLDATPTADIAVFVDEETYTHFSPADVYGGYETFYFLFNQQRRNLGTVGAGYDTYTMSDLVSGNLRKEYKINVILSPFCLTEVERSAIRQKLMCGGKTVVWEYLPGLSNGGANDLANIRSLTGFTVGIEKRRGLQTGILVGGHALTEGLAGHTYGNDLNSPADSAGPLPYIEPESGIVALAKFCNNTEKYAMAMKEMDGWPSIYSTVPNLPSQFFRNLLKNVGGNICSDHPSDIVTADQSYISIYSLYGGKRTVTLPTSQKNCSVYDVFKGSYVSVNNGKFTYTAENNETRLFRLGTAGKVAVVVLTQGGHAKISPAGITEIPQGGKLTVRASVDSGYYVEKVLVNGKNVGARTSVTLTDLTAPVSVRFVIKQIKTYTIPTSVSDGDDTPSDITPVDPENGGEEIVPEEGTTGEATGHIEKVQTKVHSIKTHINWPLLVGVTAAAVLVLALFGSGAEFFFVMQKRRKRNHED